MQQRQLGKNGPMVGAVGLGCMSFAGFYGPTDKTEAHATLARALDLGVTHLDTALIYGNGLSEEWIGDYLKANPAARDRFVIATKGGVRTKPKRGFDNSPEYLRECLEGSLKRLGVDHVALYYVHRRDQTIPIEDVTETLASFIREGKIGAFGYSEIAPSSLERAAAIHHVGALQSEYSLWTRSPELGAIQACERLGTAFVPFSPVGRGIFGTKPLDPASFGENDFRRANPRFTEENFAANEARVAAFRAYAADNGWTAASLAIAWTLARGEHLIPIPGTRTAEHLEDLAAGASIELTRAKRDEIEAILPAGFAHGDRYSDPQWIGPERYC